MKTSYPISPELEAKLKNADPEIQIFIDALISEISNLQKHNIKIEAKNVSLNTRIDALEQELKEVKTLYESSELVHINYSENDISKIPLEEAAAVTEHYKKIEKDLHDSKSPDKVK